jgi:hypothetical protein
MHNILYVYNTDRVGSKEEYLCRWPGDGWADVASCDAYLPDEGSDKRLLTPLSITAEVAAEKGIPAALAEVGCNAKGGMGGSNRTDWWTARVLEPIRRAGLFPHIAWIAGWANWTPEHCYLPWPGDKNAADYVRFLRTKEIITLDQMSPGAVRMTPPHLGEIDTRNFLGLYGKTGREYSLPPSTRRVGRSGFTCRARSLWRRATRVSYFWSEHTAGYYYGGPKRPAPFLQQSKGGMFFRPGVPLA